MAETKQFLDKLKADPAFAKQIKNCTTASEIIDAAAKNGITLSGHDIAHAMSQASPQLSEDELSSVNTDTVMAAALIK